VIAAVPIRPVDALAANGSIVHLRPMTAADTEAVRDLHTSVSARNRYLRFFTENPESATSYADRLACRDPDRGQVVLLAEQNDQLAGVGCYEPGGPGEAEVAFLIDDLHHGLGMGTLLLEHLAAVARERGVDRFLAEVLAENHGMLRVFADSGFARRSTMSGPITDLVIDTALTDMTLSQIAGRERRGEEFSLAALLSPKSVAVVGPDGDAATDDVVRNLLAAGFTGQVFLVHPDGGPAHGLLPYRRIEDVPGPVDLAVVTVGPAEAASVAAECCRAGVRTLAITTSRGGVDPLGPVARGELVALARRYGTRIVGPGCLGVVNTAPETSLHAATVGRAPQRGGFSVASQSGALGVAILDQADRTGVGISEFVSLGDKADVSGNDLLLHWWQQPRTRVIGLYLESFGNPRKFARLTRSISRDKPILVVKSGSPDEIQSAVLAQSGVLRLDTLRELIDVARVLSDQPLPRGPRLAIVTNAHGVGAIAADAAGTTGLVLPPLSAHTQDALRAIVPMAGRANPLDLGPDDNPAALGSAVALLLASGEVDAVVVALAIHRAAEATATLARVCEATASNLTVPVLATCVSAGAVPGLVAEHGIRLPVFDFPELAIRALGHALTYGDWLRREPGTVPILTDADLPAARTRVRALVRQWAGAVVPAAAAAEVVRMVGIAVLGPDATHTRSRGTVEMVIRMRTDPQFGPVVMLAPGGAAAPSADGGWRGLPLTDVDAAEMVAALPGPPPADGAGAPPVDLSALLDVLHRVALLAEHVPEIAELDLVPVVVGTLGAAVGAVRMRFADAAPAADPFLRRLSS
jgi:acyl-CoA synthetase (NDP forming)/GNAT superfamily N-acetyltransferase